jgi:hypothetical protein
MLRNGITGCTVTAAASKILPPIMLRNGITGRTVTAVASKTVPPPIMLWNGITGRTVTARVCHGYGQTRGVTVTGHAGAGAT